MNRYTCIFPRNDPEKSHKTPSKQGNSLKNPWSAPGTAPIFSSCGSNGGNPLGCEKDGKGNFGDCCGNKECDSFALGIAAESYDWPDPPTTVWNLGSIQEVAFYVGANHAGGYAYRLCKSSDKADLSESCFQNGHLHFSGDYQWVIYEKDTHSKKRTKIKALRTSEGTFPGNSMWTLNPFLPPQEENGNNDYGHGHVYDLIQVPSDLALGSYVLSIRWDCKCSPQVWNFCANIEIVD